MDFSARNLKRVAEVWMDEYKEALFESNREVYDKIDPDDLTKALEFKKSLNCKPFKYFVDVIAPDLVEKWPPFELPKFAFGAIYSEGKPSQCITHTELKDGSRLKLMPCISQNLTNPDVTQYFELMWQKCINLHPWEGKNERQFCLDMNQQVSIFGCHFNLGNQYVKFDLVRKFKK